MQFLVTLRAIGVYEKLLRPAKTESAVTTTQVGQHFDFRAFDAAKCFIDRETHGAYLMFVTTFLHRDERALDHRSNEHGRAFPVFLARSAFAGATACAGINAAQSDNEKGKYENES